jgi:AcrR family transcriptional regulator
VPKRVDHEQRRGQILDALSRIAVDGGLGAASFREIAAEAAVSVRLVQYYFGTKAELLHAANTRVAERAGARIVKAVRRIGADAAPDRIVRAVIREFLPLDEERREITILFNAFYTAQLTDPSLARREGADIPGGMAELFARQIGRAQDDGTASRDLDADFEGLLLTLTLPNVASGVIVGYLTAREASKIMDYAVDRIFTMPRSGRVRRT